MILHSSTKMKRLNTNAIPRSCPVTLQANPSGSIGKAVLFCDPQKVRSCHDFRFPTVKMTSRHNWNTWRQSTKRRLQMFHRKAMWMRDYIASWFPLIWHNNHATETAKRLKDTMEVSWALPLLAAKCSGAHLSLFILSAKILTSSKWQ